MTSFTDYKLKGNILKALDKMGIETPTEIQEVAIPKILETEVHILAQAKTGTGKTLAFSIPIAENIDPKMQQVQALIMVPTRELCKQVYEVFEELTEYREIHAVEVYGGVSIDKQISHISSGAQIVIATPGRLIDIYNRNRISFKHIRWVVLDEADRMLDMGFMPDIEFLMLEAMEGLHPKLLLFSATLLEQINDLAQRFTKGKDIYKINVSKDELTVANCKQFYYLINEFSDKYYDFIRIYTKEKPKHSMIFVNTKKTAEWLINRLIDENRIKSKFGLIMGNMTQRKRELVLQDFKSGKIDSLIATDVAARGLDIPHVSHVFNYDIPEFEENYVHRIGRTARMLGKSGKVGEGTAISLVLKDQYNILCRIESYQKKDITKRPLPPRGSYKGANTSNRRQDRGNRPSGTNTRRDYHKRPGGGRSNQRSNRSSDGRPDRRQFLY
jgi:ATP-dependent RNA helicase DeaD